MNNKTKTQYSDNGFELSDGGYLSFPDTEGAIRRRDSYGNFMEIRDRSMPYYSDWAELFEDHYPSIAIFLYLDIRDAQLRYEKCGAYDTEPDLQVHSLMRKAANGNLKQNPYYAVHFDLYYNDAEILDLCEQGNKDLNEVCGDCYVRICNTIDSLSEEEQKQFRNELSLLFGRVDWTF